MRRSIRFLRNGRIVELSGIRPGLTVLDYLRLVERQTGTKESCGDGQCGACTIVLARPHGRSLAYEAVHACTLLAAQADGCEIITVEDIAEDDGTLHPIQEALVDKHATQCGFCTAGMVMSLFALFQSTEGRADADAVRGAIQSNVCRCTGYRAQVDAGVEAMAKRRPTRHSAARDETLKMLQSIADEDEVLLGGDSEFVAVPTTLDRALALCQEHPAATLFAGATTLRPSGGRLTDPNEIVLLSRVAEMRRLVQGEKEIVIGASTPLATVQPLLAAVDVDLGRLLARLGGPQHRAVATIGGDLMLGSTDSELSAAFIALGAEAVFRLGEAERRVPLETIYDGDGTVSSELGELLVEIVVPRPTDAAMLRILRVGLRWDAGPMVVSGGFQFVLDPGGKIDSARIAFTGLGAAPGRANGAEAALIGVGPLDRAIWPKVFAALRADFSPVADHRATARYRTETAQALLGKALIEAGSRSDRRTRLRDFREESASAAG